MVLVGMEAEAEDVAAETDDVVGDEDAAEVEIEAGMNGTPKVMADDINFR